VSDHQAYDAFFDVRRESDALRDASTETRPHRPTLEEMVARVAERYHRVDARKGEQPGV
jgi:hypothetical protein